LGPLRFFNQQFRNISLDYIKNIQGPMAGRTFFQMAEPVNKFETKSRF
jgi:hypothetical protein